MAGMKSVALLDGRRVASGHGARVERLRHGPDRFEAVFGGDGSATIVVNLSEAQDVERIVRGRSDRRTARRGTATIVDPETQQRFVVTGNADVVKVVMPLSELQNYGVVGALPVLFNDPHRELERLAYRAALALEQKDEDAWTADVAPALASIFTPRLDDGESYRGGLSPAALRCVFELVEAHLELPRATSPSLSAMAAEVDLSVYHFSREFLRTVGMTPYKYTVRRRLELARDHLLRAEDDVQTISERFGFASASHFVHRFRQEMGVAPARLRALVVGSSLRPSSFHGGQRPRKLR